MSDNKEFKNNLAPFDHHVRQEKLVREYQIAIENMDIIRDRLAECVRTEHVNQFVNCRDLREKYWSLCKDRYHGMIFPADSEPKSRIVPNFTNK